MMTTPDDTPGNDRWAKALALGAALVTLGGAVLEVDPDIRQPVGVASLVVIAVLVVGWRRM